MINLGTSSKSKKTKIMGIAGACRWGSPISTVSVSAGGGGGGLKHISCRYASASTAFSIAFRDLSVPLTGIILFSRGVCVSNQHSYAKSKALRTPAYGLDPKKSPLREQ